MKRLLIPLALLALAAPSSALAGGWATAGLSPPDGGVGAGDTWNAQVNILQHGETPLSGVSPTGDDPEHVDGRGEDVRRQADGRGRRLRRKGRLPECGQVVVRGVRRLYAVRRCEDPHLRLRRHRDRRRRRPARLRVIGIVGVALVAIVFFYWLSRRVRVRAPAPAS